MIKQMCKWSLLLFLIPLLTIQQTVAQNTYNLSFFAGTRSSGYAGDNGPAKDARFYNTAKLAKDQYGNLYVADGARLRLINPNGIVSTLAGLNASSTNTEGNFDIHDIAVEQSSNDIYLLEKSKHQVRLIDNSIQGIMSIAAGTGINGFSGDGGLATQAQLNSPSAIVTDKLGNVYIADDGNRRIRKIDASTGIITTIAGTGVSGNTGDGGLATQAQISQVTDLVINKNESYLGGSYLYIAQVAGQIRRINLNTGIIEFVAGSNTGSTADGIIALQAKLGNVMGIDIDNIGNIYIAGTQYVKKITASTHLIYTIAGNGRLSPDTEGNALDVSVIAMGIVADDNGTVYMGERTCIKKLTLTQTIHTDGFIVADQVEATAGNTVKVPIKAQNLSAFAGIQFEMNFPSDKASFVGLTNINSKLTGFGTDNYNEVSSGKVRMIWADATMQNKTFQNDEVLFEIELNIPANATAGEQFLITFDNSIVIDREVKTLKVGHKTGSVTIAAASLARSISGAFKTPAGQPIKGVQIVFEGGSASYPTQTINAADNGTYSIGSNDWRPDEGFRLVPEKQAGSAVEGVDVGDLIAVRRHILQKDVLDSPYKIIAADVDLSKSINVADVLLMRRMILGMPVTLTKHWRFIPADYTFQNPANPLTENFPENYIFVVTMGTYHATKDFVGFKVGDVNFNVDPSLRTNTQAIELNTPTLDAMNGDVVRIPVTVGANYSQIAGLQGSLEFDPKVLQYQGVEAGVLSIESQHLNTANAAQGVLSFVYDQSQGEAESFDDGQVLYYLTFKAIGNAGQTAAIKLSSAQTKATAYSQASKSTTRVSLNAGEIKLIEPVVNIFPNPGTNFNVQFEVTTNESKVTFTLKDQQGKTVNLREATFAQGQHTVSFEPNVIAGNYFLTIEYNQHKIVKKVMIK